MMMLMGKDYIDNSPVLPANTAGNRASLAYAYSNIFKAANKGYYRVSAIGGGGGGSSGIFQSSNWWWEPGLSGLMSDDLIWVDRDTIQLHSSTSGWFQIGLGGAPVQVDGNGIAGGFTFVANGASSYLISANGRRGTRISTYVTNNDSSFSIAAPSPWTAEFGGTSGRAGNGGNGSGAGTTVGIGGNIRVERVW